MTLNVAAMDAAARRLLGLVDQIYRTGAAERKPVGLSQPELTELLLPFHSDDVIISYDFVRIFFSKLCYDKNFLFTFKLLLNIDLFSREYFIDFPSFLVVVVENKTKIIYDAKNEFFLSSNYKKIKKLDDFFNQHILHFLFQTSLLNLWKICVNFLNL